ncbi:MULTISPECIES: protease pro-enzyme activation domain-containing protein [unclassified Mycolicibacterium]|uniref:S53 family peptidase n=1 Tax=unclassified Mycolicibacterium TaxID=2636767 RepID=UPI00160F9B54|nr:MULTISPECIES: S53 family peptidase [unclassified Mycolicibacterium]
MGLRGRPLRVWLALLTAGALTIAAIQLRPHSDWQLPPPISGPFATLLALSTNLGDSQAQTVELTAELNTPQRPGRLEAWAAANGLSVRWRTGDRWAVVQGPPTHVANAFRVPVHDYRGRGGQVFYASPQQPAVPASLKDTVAGLGRILSFTPYHSNSPSFRPLDVPDHSLPPDSLRTTYNVRPLTEAGYTGKGTTIAVFGFDGFDQADLDMFTATYGLPKLVPEVVGGVPEHRSGESTMDLQVAHAIAPDAHKVLVNARTTVAGGSTYVKIAELMQSVDRQFPGAIWSLSIGWGCDRMITAADLAPIRGAIATALAHGTTVFDASGDLAGLECKRGHDWAAPPGPADVGLDAVASLPEVTSVGGTTLSTDENYRWLGEQAWSDGPLTQGSGGGVSSLFDRPPWQSAVTNTTNTVRRLTPDVSAVADNSTGAVIVQNQRLVVGGGTSMAAPIWAGIAAVMNQFLVSNGGRPLGEFNPMLYRLKAGASRPGFHDITLGTNAVAISQPGYDMVTGLGSPDVDNLVRNILDVQRGPR